MDRKIGRLTYLQKNIKMDRGKGRQTDGWTKKEKEKRGERTDRLANKLADCLACTQTNGWTERQRCGRRVERRTNR